MSFPLSVKALLIKKGDELENYFRLRAVLFCDEIEYDIPFEEDFSGFGITM